MQKQSYGALMISWIRWRIKAMLLVALLMADYIVVAALVHTDLSAAGYSTFLGGFVGFFIGLWDLKKYVKKYKALYSTYQNQAYSLEFLPEPENLIEQSYTEVIHCLYDKYGQFKRRVKRQNEEANDYYTLWMHQIKTPIAAMRLVIQNQKQEQAGKQSDIEDGTYNETAMANEVLEEGRRENQEELQAEPLLQLEGEVFKVEQYAEMALQYLRMENMAQDLVLKKYKLYDIVANALKKFAFMFIGKKLSIQIEPFEVEVVTDEKWLQFVVEQILSNSIKYTSRGGITIEMADAMTLKISDTGIGIENEDLPRIFERGFTGYNGRMDKKSTGIGLYLCKKVTRQLAHTLEVESQVGVGTSFYIGFKTNEAMDVLQE